MKIENIINKISGKSFEKCSVIIRKYCPDSDNSKLPKQTVTLNGFCLEERIDKLLFESLKSEIEKDGNSMLFGVMHSDDDWGKPCLLYSRQQLTNFWGIIVLENCKEHIGNLDQSSCYFEVDIVDFIS